MCNNYTGKYFSSVFHNYIIYMIVLQCHNSITINIPYNNSIIINLYNIPYNNSIIINIPYNNSIIINLYNIHYNNSIIINIHYNAYHLFFLKIRIFKINTKHNYN